MKSVFSIFFLIYSFVGFSQDKPIKDTPKKSLLQTEEQKAQRLSQKAPINLYKIISIDRDTTYVDTSLTIKDEYEYNFLRKDNFAKMSFANEGQPYIDFKVNSNKGSQPNFGFKSKTIFFEEFDQIKYYSVATPLTELYFKTVMEQGQSLDALVTTNTSERFNISFSFKGLRSKGKYSNQGNSSGNFRFTSSYNTLNRRYFANLHFTGQDILNGENGGVFDIENFISKDDAYRERIRLSVYLSDAFSFQKGKRLFLDHFFKINDFFSIKHQSSLENKFFEYNQQTVATSIDSQTPFIRFGTSFNSKINDQVNYKRSYNKLGFQYTSHSFGSLHLFIDDSRFNQYYGKVIITSTQVIPGRIKQNLNALGFEYKLTQSNWNSKIQFSKSFSSQVFSNLDANVSYQFDTLNQINLQVIASSKIPDNNFRLHQSSYENYNWANQFKNEKTNTININAKTQWLDATLQYTSLTNHLYFEDSSSNSLIQLIKPKQYLEKINNFSLQLNKELKYGKFALDNYVLLQQTNQQADIVNLPKLVTRNTFYYSNYFYKRALYIQTGVIFNYFSAYNVNDYNPVLSEFYVQNKTKIGSYPMFDFFINARIRQTRIFIKAEHFNSAFSNTNTFLTAPNYPYRDFIVRFGIVWNFFQ